MNCSMVLAVLLMSEFEKLWSLEEAHSSPSSAATRFSPITSRIPDGTLAVTPMQLTDPF